jgi:hypothetical protein
MPLSTRQKRFGRIYGAALTIVGAVVVYASYTSIIDLGAYWLFFFAFGLILVAMGLPILILRLK